MDGYEITGSQISNSAWDGPDCAAIFIKRDDSHVRYTVKGEDTGGDVSYFGRVLFYMHHLIPAQTQDKSMSPEEDRLEDSERGTQGDSVQMLAYVQWHIVGRIRKRKLAHKVKDSIKEFIEVSDIQELVGFIQSHGRLFYVSKTSCFWPKKNFAWNEVIDNAEFLPEEED
ncbi:hypothetical protein P167DRAFT_546972 [Morchella conica CCBAS932]|uniref:Uncharacterized protein n=1 Tax=Morchella conica CCBAS932 TaxID=1392247 RepID=A0A3N4KJF9_9PEZI|nr:hypothetical protein P167DRAFT_546972 [Morchella conica CCBAS932]